MCTEIGRPPVQVSLGTLEDDGRAPGPASVGYRAFGYSRKPMEVIGSRTSDNPAALDQQKNNDTSKLPLNSVKMTPRTPTPSSVQAGAENLPQGKSGCLRDEREVCAMGERCV